MKTANQAYSQEQLDWENGEFRMTSGVSENNREEGFVPAFQDTATGDIYRSRFANGSPAPIHLFDGLPQELVVQPATDDRPIAFKATLVAGFLRAEHFYTREQAAQFSSS